MQKIVLVFGLIFSLVASPLLVDAAVKVNGYFRKDGTYVQPHYRSNPDGNPYNNYSFPGNTNPFTGVVAPGNQQTYLDNYFNTGSNTSYSLPSTTYTTTLAAPSVTAQAPKYTSLTKGAEWVEYVGQHDACAY